MRGSPTLTTSERIDVVVSLGRRRPFEHDLTRPPLLPRAVVWRCTEPAIVLGASQRRLLPVAEGIPVSCRRSGGGAVLVGPWLVNVSVLLPADHPLARLDVRAAADWLGDLHLRALESCGLEASRAAEGVQPDVAWACFGGVARGELVARGRKLTGIAQERRQAGVVLVAGTLVTPPDWRLLCDAFGRRGDAAALDAVTVSCTELGSITPGALAAALAAQLRAESHIFVSRRHAGDQVTRIPACIRVR